MSQPFSLNINAAPQRAMLVTRPPAVADHSGSGSSMSEEELDFITSMSSGSTVSVKPKEEKKNYIILDMQVPEYDAQRSILAQNKIPGLDELNNEDDKYRLDVATRPESCGQENYEATPVHLFGDGYMRSLGWKPGDPLGMSNKAVVDVVTFIPRPQGLGLGAKLPTPEELEQRAKDKGFKKKDKKNHINKPGEKYAQRPQYELPMDADGKIRHTRKLDEQLQVAKVRFYKGAPLEIMGGPHKGLKAKVIRQETQDTLLVLLTASEEKVLVKMNDADQLDDREVILRRKREEEERKRRKEEERERRKEAERRERKRKREEEEYEDRYKKPKREDGKNITENRVNYHDGHRDNNWLRNDIRVKIVSKKLGDGKYYCKAGWVVDVLGRGRCIVKLEQTNVILEGVKQEDLETVVPGVQQPVVVVQGEWKGQTGKILERQSAQNKLVVQLDEDFEIVTLRMDDVAQFR